MFNNLVHNFQMTKYDKLLQSPLAGFVHGIILFSSFKVRFLVERFLIDPFVIHKSNITEWSIFNIEPLLKLR